MNDTMRVATAIRQAADELYARGKRGFCWNEELGGGCGDCSIVLWEMLGNDLCSLISGTYDGASHCWVLLQTGAIVDLTATQFGVEDKVYVVDADPMYKTLRVITGELDRYSCWGDETWRGLLRQRAEEIMAESP